MANFSSSSSRIPFPSLSPEVYIQQLIEEAKTRWLKPAEICEILKNHDKLPLSEAAPDKPASGLLYLFDRNKLRNFRKDGHDWRKKKDGKTIREAHEKLKVENKDVIHCYYAHGERNPNFQRRCYWLLEGSRDHIVLVHYREVMESNVLHPVQVRPQQMVTQQRRYQNPISSPSGDTCQSFASNDELNFSSTVEVIESTVLHPVQVQPQHMITDNRRYQHAISSPSGDACQSVSSNDELNIPSTVEDSLEIPHIHQFPNADERNLSINNIQEHPDPSLQRFKSSDDHINGANNLATFQNELHNNTNFTVTNVQDANPVCNWHGNCFGQQLIHMEDAYQVKVKTPNCSTEDLQFNVTSDENSPWVSNDIFLESQTYWENIKGSSIMSNLPGQARIASSPSPQPSLQNFYDILDFAPQWSYAFEETKVVVAGIFLHHTDISNTKLCCMFGDIEVPAEILRSGAICCKAPPLKPGTVSFCVTNGGRVACSNILKFHYQERVKKDARQQLELQYQIRLFQLLITKEDEACSGKTVDRSPDMKNNMLEADETSWSRVGDLAKNNVEDGKSMFLQMLLRYEFEQWLCKGRLKYVDKHGTGVLHLVAALGYDWAITSILEAGIGVDFRDAKGWTALHWAAYCGRKKVIALLLAAGASPGALTDPTPSDATGRTAADLAASSGHHGIAGYLAELSLTNHLTYLNLRGNDILGVMNQYEDANVASGKNNMQASSSMKEDDLSMSLAAVRNATQAATRIQAAFRAYSFRKINTMDMCFQEFGLSEEEARAFAYTQSSQTMSHERRNLAATQIQCKYRAWKGQKDFTALKKHVIKIQAHVRGHQARKKYKQLVWVVGLIDKVILRWRRKGNGLRGVFKGGEDASAAADSDDDDNILKDFRRRKEEGFLNALNRVKRMVDDPTARHQYRRMLQVYEQHLLEKGDQFFMDEDIVFDDDLIRFLFMDGDDLQNVKSV